MGYKQRIPGQARYQNWQKEFREYLNSEEKTPPGSLRESLFKKIHRKLHPTMWQVLTKLTLVQAIVGGLTLLLCPQFGIYLLDSAGDSGGLLVIFNRFGTYGCMAFCGAFFLGSGALLSAFVFWIEEIQKLLKYRAAYFLTLGILSIGLFLILGGDITGSIAIAWLVGSVLGGVGSFEAGWWVRRHMMRGRVS